MTTGPVRLSTGIFWGGPLGGEVKYVGKGEPEIYRDGAYGTYVHEQCRNGTMDYDAWSGCAVYRRVGWAGGQPVYVYCGQDPVIVRYDSKKQMRRYGLL